MNKRDKVDYIERKLEELYPEVDIPLQSSDPYTHLIAVVLSAQCTDARVNQVTPNLFAKARTPVQMAAVPVEAIEEIIRSCGLAPRKSRAISEFSQLIVDRHGGLVPCDLEALEALPGVGHKTAQVVLAQNFGIPTFPVDTHIHRLAWRWGLSNGKKRPTDRARPEEALPGGGLEQTPSANYLLWPRVLPGSRSRLLRLPTLCRRGPQEPLSLTQNQPDR